MDTPPSNRKRRDPEAHKRKQKLYRQRQYAKVNGIEECQVPAPSTLPRAHGAYESDRGVRGLCCQKSRTKFKRYQAISEEKRVDVRRRNAQSQKNWMQRMKEEGTYEAYKQRVNAQRRALQAERKQAMGPDLWKALQSSKIRAATTTTTMAMVRRALGASLSPPVVAVRLGRVRA